MEDEAARRERCGEPAPLRRSEVRKGRTGSFFERGIAAAAYFFSGDAKFRRRARSSRVISKSASSCALSSRLERRSYDRERGRRLVDALGRDDECCV